MSVLDAVRTPKLKPPKEVQERLDRGRLEMSRGQANRRLCIKFWKGEHYWYLNGKGILDFQSTVTTAGGKPAHRIRNRYNFIEPIVQGKVSQATQRTPSYQILPTTTDPNDRHAAHLATKVALFGYDKWRLRRATIKAVEWALVCGEGFVMPYFDSNVGPFIVDRDPVTGEVITDAKGNPQRIGTGEIKVLVLSGNEVFWEPGCDFEDSRWHAIERARPIEEVEGMPNYTGGKLTADATVSDIATDRRPDNMVLVTEYLERPCKQYPQGRRVIVCNGRQVCPTEDYPAKDAQGQAVDEPVLHKLSWTVDPDADRDRGLVEQLVDLQRTVNDCWNKLLEWKNRTLHPQMTAPRGANLSRRTDEPGQVIYYNKAQGEKPEWEKNPPVPQELFQMLGQAIQHMRDIAADSSVQAEADLAARTVQAVIEQANSRWQTFIADLAEFHSRVMRSCLALVARHYSEERLIQIQGDFGPDLTTGFTGADLRSQIDIRVFPQSLQPVSQEAVENRATNWAQLGWITPTAAMMAIENGTTEGLMQSYQQSVSRVNEIIERLKQGPEALFSTPERWDPKMVNPETGQQGMYVPGWMPREFDDVDVELEVLTTWMRGAGFERLEPGLQEAAFQIYEALKSIKAQRELEAQVAQTQMAEALGSANAARPQLAKPLPDQPAPQS